MSEIVQHKPAAQMPKRVKHNQAPKSKTQLEALKGWQQIADFLGEPVSVVHRWARSGMPASRQGRFQVATPSELNAWLGRESGKPLHVATPETDLAAELKRGLNFIRHEKHSPPDTKRSA
jgi:hypothetical protein